MGLGRLFLGTCIRDNGSPQFPVRGCVGRCDLVWKITRRMFYFRGCAPGRFGVGGSQLITSELPKNILGKLLGIGPSDQRLKCFVWPSNVRVFTVPFTEECGNGNPLRRIDDCLANRALGYSVGLRLLRNGLPTFGQG